MSEEERREKEDLVFSLCSYQSEVIELMQEVQILEQKIREKMKMMTKRETELNLLLDSQKKAREAREAKKK